MVEWLLIILGLCCGIPLMYLGVRETYRAGYKDGFIAYGAGKDLPDWWDGM